MSLFAPCCNNSPIQTHPVCSPIPPPLPCVRCLFSPHVAMIPTFVWLKRKVRLGHILVHSKLLQWLLLLSLLPHLLYWRWTPSSNGTPTSSSPPLTPPPSTTSPSSKLIRFLRLSLTASGPPPSMPGWQHLATHRSEGITGRSHEMDIDQYWSFMNSVFPNVFFFTSDANDTINDQLDPIS